MVWVVSLSSADLITRGLTPALSRRGIRSLHGFGKLVGPLVQAVLYLHDETRRAVPKNISERTSYHEV